MTPVFPELPADLGVYTLTRLLGTHATCDRYIARQSHVERSVVIEVLRPGSTKEILDSFLRTARMRVAAKVPHVSLVLETMVSGDIWYITSECPEGTPLSQLREDGRHLGTVQACTVIQRVGELYEHCARKGFSTEVLTPDSIFVREDGGVTFLSPLVAGVAAPELHGRQLDALAATLRDISPEGETGQTRIATLLEWLGQSFDGQRMEWQAVVSMAEYIKESVAPSPAGDKTRKLLAETPYARKRRLRQYRRSILKYAFITSVCLLGAGGISMLGCVISPLFPGATLPAVGGDYVCCRTNETVVAVMSSPVSIGQYREFLEAYANMPAKKRSAVNKGIPAAETDHTPAEWERQLRSVEGTAEWQGRKLYPDSPVCGVSYWDAMAYANYRGASLPSSDLLYTVRKATELPPCEEWSDTTLSSGTIYERAILVLPAKGSETPRPESDTSEKKLNRSFRIVLPSIPRQEP